MYAARYRAYNSNKYPMLGMYGGVTHGITGVCHHPLPCCIHVYTVLALFFMLSFIVLIIIQRKDIVLCQNKKEEEEEEIGSLAIFHVSL